MLEGMTPTSRYDGPCQLIKRANELDETDKKILLDALNDPRFSHLRLSSELTERGFAVGDNVIRRHRVGICACARDTKATT